VLPDRLTAQRYPDFLETVLPGLLEVVPLAMKTRLWFQHYGVPAHCVEDVRRHIQEGGLDVEGQLHGLLGRRI
jgi:hypothetical protein